MENKPIIPRMYALDEITIRMFMRCIFNKDYGHIENFEDLYTEYIDRSGMGKDGQLGVRQNIHNLKCRLGKMTGWLQIQMDVLAYNVSKGEPAPHYGSMKDVQEYGHFPIWNGDQDYILLHSTKDAEEIQQAIVRLNGHASSYKKQLLRIEAVEKSYKSQLNMAEKELKQMEGAEKPETIDARNSFFTLLAVIGKNQCGAIDKDKTCMHEFAIMVKMYNEERKRIESQNSKMK